jgi:hypothetical protein
MGCGVSSDSVRRESAELREPGQKNSNSGQPFSGQHISLKADQVGWGAGPEKILTLSTDNVETWTRHSMHMKSARAAGTYSEKSCV